MPSDPAELVKRLRAKIAEHPWEGSVSKGSLYKMLDEEADHIERTAAQPAPTLEQIAEVIRRSAPSKGIRDMLIERLTALYAPVVCRQCKSPMNALPTLWQCTGCGTLESAAKPVPPSDTSAERVAESEKLVHVEPIPTGVYYAADSKNFYNANTRYGMGTAFYERWCRLRSEFPQTQDGAIARMKDVAPPAAADVTLNWPTEPGWWISDDYDVSLFEATPERDAQGWLVLMNDRHRRVVRRGVPTERKRWWKVTLATGDPVAAQLWEMLAVERRKVAELELKANRYADHNAFLEHVIYEKRQAADALHAIVKRLEGELDRMKCSHADLSATKGEQP